jgi:hypothetical protein
MMEDYCVTNQPCQNNATCQYISGTDYQCMCLDGFIGAD